MDPAATTSKNGPAEHSDSSSTSLGLYDSDEDQEYLPDKLSSTDSEESSTMQPSKYCKVTKKSRPKKTNLPMVRQNYLQLTSDDSYINDNPAPLDQIDVSNGLHDNDIETIQQRKVKNKTHLQQPGRKRVRHEGEWLCNVRKRKRANGEEYTNKKGKLIPAKVLKPPCSCRMKCSEAITEDERKEIFKLYWNETTSTDVKRQFVSSCILCVPTLTSRKRNIDSDKRKENTLYYHFMVNNKKIRVCKTFFLNTLNISNKVVINVLKSVQQGGIVKPDQRGKKTPPNKTPDATIQGIIHHISTFPQYESHYNREKSAKNYLGPELNVEKMYELYLTYCKDNNVDQQHIAGKWLYRDVFNKHFNLTFKAPEVDTCDTCDSFRAQIKGDLPPEEQILIKSQYDAHLIESEKRYSLKSDDSKTAKENPNHRVLTGDLQKCLPTPMITSSLSFYKRKLWTLNYTLYDSSDSSAHCIMWDETKGARGGNEIASALLKWADSVIPGSEINEITLWSDNCYGQNKNKSIIMCFIWLLKKYPQLKQISQKFLLKGHTHMEADTVHALIERKRKKIQTMTILTPWDWQQLVRQTSNKYHVHNMEVEDFKNFELLTTGKTSPFISRKVGVNKEPVYISQCVMLQVRQEHLGHLFLKTTFSGEFIDVNLVRFRREEIPWPADLINVSNQRLPINRKKYSDLMSLLHLLPTVCHDFYKNLLQTSNAPEYPREDTENPDD